MLGPLEGLQVKKKHFKLSAKRYAFAENRERSLAYLMQGSNSGLAEIILSLCFHRWQRPILPLL